LIFGTRNFLSDALWNEKPAQISAADLCHQFLACVSL